MTLFTNGYVTLKTLEGFTPVSNRGEFVELTLVNADIPMTIKFSVSPTSAGLPDIKNVLEKSINANPDIEVKASDFIVINETDIYFMLVSSIKTPDAEICRNEFLFVKDNNLYSFEYVYPYADAQLDDFYLNLIRSMKISKAKYILCDGGFEINK